MCAIAIPIILGVAQAGLGIVQAVAANNEAQRQVAYQNMVAEQQYQAAKNQADAARTVEAQRAAMRDEEIQRNTELARLTRANQIGQINVRQMQEREAAGQKKQETAKRALEAAGTIRARGQIGANVDLLLADVRRQQASFDYYTDRNLAFVNLELQERKRIAQGEMANRIANQTPYLQQTILDPYRQADAPRPSSTPYLLQGASAVLGGISTGLSTYGAMKDAGLFNKTQQGITSSTSSLANAAVDPSYSRGLYATTGFA